MTFPRNKFLGYFHVVPAGQEAAVAAKADDDFDQIARRIEGEDAS